MGNQPVPPHRPAPADALQAAVAAFEAAHQALETAHQALAAAEALLEEAGHVPHRRPVDQPAAAVKRGYLSVTDYAYKHSVDRKTVYKWMEMGVVQWYRRPDRVLRVLDSDPPTEECT